AGAWAPARWLRAFQFDEERRDLAPALGSRDRHRIAHEPNAAIGIILRREGAAGFRPANHANQVGTATGRPDGAHRRILPSLRDKAAIDDDEPAGRELGSCEYPIAGSGHVAAQGRAAG